MGKVYIFRGKAATGKSTLSDMILDIALGDRANATHFYNRLDFGDNTVIKFFLACTDEIEWKRRHLQRQENPLPHQSFKSYEHVIYKGYYGTVEFSLKDQVLFGKV